MTSKATQHAIQEPRTQEEVARLIANEIIGEETRVASNDAGPVSYRMRKGDRAAILQKVQGLRFALTVALGAPFGDDSVDEYLAAYRAERVRARTFRTCHKCQEERPIHRMAETPHGSGMWSCIVVEDGRRVIRCDS